MEHSADASEPDGAGSRAGSRLLSCAATAIVAMLAAFLLFEWWAGAVRIQGRARVCAANLKCLASHLLQYAQDYDERLPLAGGWDAAVLPYVKNTGPFRCPADRTLQPLGYGYNGRVAGRRLEEFGGLDGVISLFDRAAGGRGAPGASPRPADPPRHGATNNFAFLDGHVKPLVKVDAPLWGPAPGGSRSAPHGAARRRARRRL